MVTINPVLAGLDVALLCWCDYNAVTTSPNQPPYYWPTVLQSVTVTT